MRQESHTQYLSKAIRRGGRGDGPGTQNAKETAYIPTGGGRSKPFAEGKAPNRGWLV